MTNSTDTLPTRSQSDKDRASREDVQSANDQALEQVAARFCVKLPVATRSLIDPSDRYDPIALQYLPSVDELLVTPEELLDPVGERRVEVCPNVYRKYSDRVLLKVTGLCAVYCRFCFRRNTVGHEGTISNEHLSRAIEYIAGQTDVWEVILSGGDPLVLSLNRLCDIIGRLEDIHHVKSLRIHSKVPIVAPERISVELVKMLRRTKPIWLAIHCNHPREITKEVQNALARLADGGIPLISQTVLLRGVNDDAATLEELFRRLVTCRVKPYYLHHLDQAEGTHRFRVSIEKGQQLVEEMVGSISGICIPSYVLDLPGGQGKVPISRSWLSKGEGNTWHVRDRNGQTQVYNESIDSIR